MRIAAVISKNEEIPQFEIVVKTDLRPQFHWGGYRAIQAESTGVTF